MDRRTTIKTLREIIHVLKDEAIFDDHDFYKVGDPFLSRVDLFIQKKLDL